MNKLNKNALNNANKTFFLVIIKHILFSKLVFPIIFLFSRIIYKITFFHFKFSLINNKTVIGGPFKGLRYCEAKYASGPLLPRLLGTYEAELHDTLYEFKNNKYEEIINVGAAEGYYTIGLSIFFPSTKIRAYEIDPIVFSYTNKMIKYNNKENQIELINKDALKDFQNIKLNQRLLIFVDCEGCEFEIFDKDITENFLSSDLIIEMHVKDLDTTILESNFFKTHHIQKVFGQNRKYLIEEYLGLDIRIKDFYELNELERFERNSHHYFLILRSKKANLG